jgi:tRNA-2-methylthio-N6-dimethylallyladenosine synthase
MNISDSERMHAIIRNMGYIHTDNEEEANLLGILACSVRQKSIDKVYSRISKWNKWKNKRDLISFVTGCVLPADKEKFLKLFDLIFPMSEAGNFPDMIREYGVTSAAGLSHFNKIGIPLNDNIFSLWDIQPSYRSEFEAFVPIQNGCDKFCTFCAVPYTRGREVSRPSSEILGEISKLVRSGYKSITLLGQNVNSYGLDVEEEINFAGLLEKIGKLGIESEREFLVYFTSPHPRDMSPDVIDVISDYKHLAKQIHLPLQSGDDKVLIRMNRKYSVENYREIIRYIREKLPEATLFTDIIVGFTGETEEQFQNTVSALEEFRFNMAYVAQYSPRPGAAAYRWDDDVPKEEKKKRLHILSAILANHSGEYNKKLIGQNFRVLVTGSDRKQGFLSGMTEGKINVRFQSENSKLIGSFVDLKITSATDFSLQGELVKEMVNG